MSACMTDLCRWQVCACGSNYKRHSLAHAARAWLAEHTHVNVLCPLHLTVLHPPGPKCKTLNGNDWTYKLRNIYPSDCRCQIYHSRNWFLTSINITSHFVIKELKDKEPRPLASLLRTKRQGAETINITSQN